MISHPTFPAGLNADDYNGDEYDGAGTNWPIREVLFDSFEGLVPLILTEEMEEVFEDCPDLIFPCDNKFVVFQPRADTSVVVAATNISTPHALPGAHVPAQQRVQQVRADRRDTVLAPQDRGRMLKPTSRTRKVDATDNVVRLKRTGNTLHQPAADTRVRVSANRELMVRPARNELPVEPKVRTLHLRKWR